MLRRVRLPTPENVAEGSRFQVKLPIGPTYTKVDLVLAGTAFTAAMISNLEFAINGRAVQRFATGTHLNRFNQRLCRPAQATNGILTLHFRRDEMEEIEDASLFDIGTAKKYADGRDAEVIVETLTISGDISGSTSPMMTAYATTSSNIRPLGMIQKVLNFPKTVAISTSPGTESDLDGFPIGYPNAVLLAAHLVESTDGIITKLRASANIRGANVDLLEDIPVAVLKQADEAVGNTEQTAMVHWDLISDSGQALDGLPLAEVGDLRLRPTCAHASITTGALTVYLDLADTFQGA